MPLGVPGSADLAMRSAGAMAALASRVDQLDRHLASLDLWEPATPLLAETNWTRGALARMASAWGNKLAVVLVGPSGVGKSSLLNALAEQDISATGLERPTTQDLVVYCQHASDASGLLDTESTERMHVYTAPTARGLDHLLLVDTPDTNTTPQNRELLGEVLDRADLVLVTLSAQNPKLHDNLTFLAPYVDRLAEGAVVVVLNRVDRVSSQELLDDVVPDLRRALGEVWATPVAELFLTCARPPEQILVDEQPLHEINQMDALRQFLYGELNRAEQVVDRRLAQGEHLVDALYGRVEREVQQVEGSLIDAAATLEGFRNDLSTDAEPILQAGAAAGQVSGLAAALYGQMAQRAWGPVGWLIVVWSVLLRFGGMIRSLFGSSEGMHELIVWPQFLTFLQQSLGMACASRWPDVARALTEAGFTREVAERTSWQRVLNDEELWRELVSSELASRIARSARRLASWPVQLLLNAPVLGMSGYVCYDTVSSFVAREWLPVGYYQQAGIAILTLWGLGFVVQQVLAALSLRRLRGSGLSHTIVEQLAQGLTKRIDSQIDDALALGEVADRN